MSFDLLFYSIKDQKFEIESLRRWLSAVPNYEVHETQAEYFNPETDVHFMFEFAGESYFENEPVPDLIGLVNYIRPTPFAAEAGKEFEKISRELAFQVLDPQRGDGSPRQWSYNQFIETYLDHAGRAFRALWTSDKMGSEQREAMEDSALPRSDLWRAWQWNYDKQATYTWLESHGRDLFVPTFQFLQIGESLYDCFVWTDAVPSVLPDTSHVLLYREDTAWKRAFSRSNARPTFELIPTSTIMPLIEEYYERLDDWQDRRFAKSDTAPRELLRVLKSRKPGQDAVNRHFYQDQQQQGPHEERMLQVGFSQLLDIELFD